MTELDPPDAVDHVCAPADRMSPASPDTRRAKPVSKPVSTPVSTPVRPIRTLPTAAAFTRAELRRCGWSDQAITRAVRSGRLHRLRHGVLSAVPATPELAARATTLACHGAVVSHRSALVLHDLPVVGGPAPRPELTALPFGTGRLADAALHRATLPADDVVTIAGCPVTSVARTLVDVARSRPITCAVAAIDAALYRRMVTMDEIERVLNTCWNWPGIGRAQRALRFVDPRAESPLESVSRLVIGWLRLPAPQPQVLVLDERGIVLARLDFYWDDVGVAGEADGRVKYADRSVLTDEKERQESVEDLGVPFARWGWHHTTRPQLLKAKIMRAFDRGRARDRSGLRRGWSIVPT